MKASAVFSLLILVSFFSNCSAVREGILKVLPIFEDAEKLTSSLLDLKDEDWCDPDSCTCTELFNIRKCTCSKVKNKCNDGCKYCVCPRVYPPICRCLDIKDYCPTKQSNNV